MDILTAKYGSGVTTNDDGIDQLRINHHAEELAEMQDRFGLIIVTSGAVAAGQALWRTRLSTSQNSDMVPTLQSFASIGSPRIFTAWQEALDRVGIVAGAISITHHEIDDPAEGSMFAESVRANLKCGIATILNENDAVSDIELARLSYGGENDGLAYHGARAIGAHTFILFTSKGGILSNEGHEIPVIPRTDFQTTLSMMKGRRKGANGRGGPYVKTLVGIMAAKAGMDSFIARPDQPIVDILEGRVGTRFDYVAKAARTL